jgi:hypothetical protein
MKRARISKQKKGEVNLPLKEQIGYGCVVVEQMMMNDLIAENFNAGSWVVPLRVSNRKP